MSATLYGALATAGLLGVTHAIEPDHVAGISSLTSQYGDSRLSALVGACFSLGHVALVIVWLVAGYLLLGRTSFPEVFDAVGTFGVVVLLGVLGAVMAVGGLRTVLHAHEHEHDDEVHSHVHLHVPLLGSDHDETRHSHDDQSGTGFLEKTALGHSHAGHGPDYEHDGHAHAGHDHGHGVANYLKTGLVGALFTLSPPLSMIAFSSTLFPQYGTGVVALAVAAYAVSITVTMSLIGAGVGTLFGVTALSPRTYGAARVLGGVLIVGLAASMLTDVVPSLA